MEDIIDYSDIYEDGEFSGNLVKAHGRNKSFLSLTKLSQPFKRADGVKAHYVLKYCWLNKDCQNENDQAWACVEGFENTFWTKEELEDHEMISTSSLFSVFNLF